MKKIGFLFGIIFILILNGHVAQAQSNPAININVIIDQYNLVLFPDQKPYVDSNNRTLVPVRFISEELGATVQWHQENRQVIIIFEGNTIQLTLNSNIAAVRNGGIERQINMGTTAVSTSAGRVMVPLRFVTEAFGALVIWEESSQTVFIERMVQRKPDERLLDDFVRFDTETFKRISQRSGYKLLRNWSAYEGARTSSGEFMDYLLPINETQFGDTFYFDYNVQNNSNVSWISIYFSTDETQNNFFFYDLTQDIIQNKNQVIINRKQFQVGAGNPSWADIKYFRIAMQSKDGTSFSIDPKNLATYNGSKAMITLWFDDGWEDNYTNAFRITSRIDPAIRGTIGLVGSLIGKDRYLIKEQLPLLKAAGWEFVSHSYTHPLLTELNEQEIRLELQRNFNVVSNYDPIGAYHFVVPFSAVNDRVIKIIKENALSARYISGSLDSVYFDRYKLGFIEVTNTTDFRTVRNAIDKAIDNNQWVGLLFHRIEDPAIDRYSYGTQQFEQLIYYLSFRRDDIKVVTPSEAFREAGMPIGIRP
jgi:peptidoglycan/xylan/chitin deacetylase (PgdA/CDA1 family)